MRIVRFEDIESWKEGRILCRMVYGATSKGKFKVDFGLKEQIQRASVSVISNIAEGLESKSNSEFHRFLVYSRRSVSEVKSQLYVALDAGHISQKEFDTIYSQADKVGRLINGFVRYLTSPPRTSKPSNKPTDKPAN